MASIMDGERQFHIQTLPEEVAICYFTGRSGEGAGHCGAPQEAKQVACNREYNVYTGLLDGEKVTVCSTGIGGPSRRLRWKSW